MTVSSIDHRRTETREAMNWAPVVGGSALLALGLSRRSLGGLFLALLGAGLVYRGVASERGYSSMPSVGKLIKDRAKVFSLPPGRAIHMRRAVTINESPGKLYRYWRELGNLPRFMRHLRSVERLEGNRSHWVADAPMGARVEWDAEIVEESENELIRWRSLPGAEVPNSGTVTFRPASGGRGVVVEVQLEYQPPAGPIGAAFAKLFPEDPSRQIKDDLRRFKQLMEAGEIATTEGQPAGRRA